MATSLLLKPCIQIELTFGHKARDDGVARTEQPLIRKKRGSCTLLYGCISYYTGCYFCHVHEHGNSQDVTE
jgi:hypothetical protein